LKRCDFRCDDQTRCLTKNAVCNQIVDCIDESDEAPEMCQNVTSVCDEGHCDSGNTDYCDEFICANGNCVELILTCDSEDNCG
jgi:low-density lipoprotein receptor-related protein 1 (alpha-2-macroglobulin receptor)